MMPAHAGQRFGPNLTLQCRDDQGEQIQLLKIIIGGGCSKNYPGTDFI